MPNKEAERHHWGPFRALFHRLPERDLLIVLSLVVGLLCGAAAVLLKLTIHGIQALVAGHGFNWTYLFLPGTGMLLSYLLLRFVIRKDISHGVTKVLLAVSKNESRIEPHNLWSSFATSALTIGFGGSVGAEAPIVYTGAAIGSNLARKMDMSYRSMTVLLGCGAAGAIAGMFNAPLAGVLFTLEILFFNISMTAILPLLVSTVSATMVSYLCLGQQVQFELATDPFSLAGVPLYVLLGVLCGFCSLYFIRMTLSLEDRIGRWRNPWLKWFVCAALLGLLVYLFPPLFGEGYNSVGALLKNDVSTVEGGFLLPVFSRMKWGIPLFFSLIFFLKVFSMTFTNAGGGVGGTFGPTLFAGAIAGYIVASALNLIHPGLAPTANYVLVGMAGLMAGVMQAPLTAIFLIVEISGGYQLLLPLILTSAISYGTIRIFEKYSIYSKRIAMSGELLTHDSDQAVLTLLRLDNLIEKDFQPVSIDATLGELVEAVSTSERSIFPVLDRKGRFQGFVSLQDIRKDMFVPDLYDKKHVYNYVRSAPEYIYEGEPMESVMRKFEKTGAWNLPVVTKTDRHYIGFLSKSMIFNAYREELRVFSQD